MLCLCLIKLQIDIEVRVNLFCVCVYVCVFASVCNVIMNVLQLYCAVSRAVQSYALKREFCVAVQEPLCCVLHYSIISSRTFHLSPEGQG